MIIRPRYQQYRTDTARIPILIVAADAAVTPSSTS